MSRNDQKAGRIPDMDFSALDMELAEMARETPDIPADFHNRWMQAVRDDAAGRRNEATASGRDNTERRKEDARKQRRYILSAAVAFVLVIGIAMMLRNQTDNPFNRVKTTPVPAAQEQTEPAVSATPEPEQTVLPSGQAEKQEQTTPVPVPNEEPEESEEAADTGAPLLTEDTDAACAEEPAEALYSAVMAGSAGEVNLSLKAKQSQEQEKEEEEEEATAESADLWELDYVGETADNGDQNLAAGTSMPVYAAILSNYALGSNADSTEEERAEEEIMTAEAEEAESRADEPELPAETAEPIPAAEVYDTAEESSDNAGMTEATAEQEEPEKSGSEEKTADAADTREPAREPEGDREEAAAAGTPAKNTQKPEKTEAEPENTSFMQRLWETLLMITPWALGIAVVTLFLVTYVIRYKGRKRK